MNETDIRVILHVSDWNMQDKWYQTDADTLQSFADRIRAQGIETAWDWFIALTDGPVIRVDDQVDMTLDRYFIDWHDPIMSVDEWEFD